MAVKTPTTLDNGIPLKQSLAILLVAVVSFYAGDKHGRGEMKHVHDAAISAAAQSDRILAEKLGKASGSSEHGEMFSQIDGDGSKTVNAIELQKALKMVGVNATMAVVEAVLRGSDENNDGNLSPKEFEVAMKHQKSFIGSSMRTTGAFGLALVVLPSSFLGSGFVSLIILCMLGQFLNEKGIHPGDVFHLVFLANALLLSNAIFFMMDFSTTIRLACTGAFLLLSLAMKSHLLITLVREPVLWAVAAFALVAFFVTAMAVGGISAVISFIGA